MSQSLTVIIPSLNSPVIDKVLAVVLEQVSSRANSNIVVVGLDEASLIPDHEAITFIDTKVPVLAAVARNRGIAATEAEILVFLDSDCLPAANWLSEHIKAQTAGHPVVSGGIEPAGDNYWHLVYNLTLFHEILSVNPPGPRDFLATLNLSIHHTIIDNIGGMDETIDRVEDVEWTTRMRKAGIQPYFWPKALVYHRHNRLTMKAVWDDCAISGFYMRRLRLQYSDWLQAPQLLRHKRLVLVLSPLIAAWVTAGIVFRRSLFLSKFPQTIPAIYMTKVAWCWGASRPTPPG